MERTNVKEACPKTGFKFAPRVGIRYKQSVWYVTISRQDSIKFSWQLWGQFLSRCIHSLHSLNLTRNTPPDCWLVSFFLENKKVIRSRGQKLGKIFSDLQLRQKASKAVFYYHPEPASCLDSVVYQEWNNLEMCPDFTMCQLCGLGEFISFFWSSVSHFINWEKKIKTDDSSICMVYFPETLQRSCEIKAMIAL